MCSQLAPSQSPSVPGSQSSEPIYLSLERPLKVLTPAQLEQIDAALDSLGSFGEVRLIKIDGRLRFIHRVESRDLLADGKDGSEGR